MTVCGTPFYACDCAVYYRTFDLVLLHCGTYRVFYSSATYLVATAVSSVCSAQRARRCAVVCTTRCHVDLTRAVHITVHLCCNDTRTLTEHWLLLFALRSAAFIRRCCLRCLPLPNAACTTVPYTACTPLSCTWITERSRHERGRHAYVRYRLAQLCRGGSGSFRGSTRNLDTFVQQTLTW